MFRVNNKDFQNSCIVNFEHISHRFLVFLQLILKSVSHNKKKMVLFASMKALKNDEKKRILEALFVLEVFKFLS